MPNILKRPVSPLAVVFGLSGIFFVLFLIVSAALFFGRSPESWVSGSKKGIFRGGAVGIIELNGVILDSKKLLKQIRLFADNDSVKALVVRINSPGGAVAPSQEIYEALKAIKKPVVASMGSVAASGGYYVACGAQKIFANAGTITGSIGVIMEFANLSKLYEWAKVERYSIKTGKYKDAGAEYRKMSDEERELFQKMVNDVLGQFKEAVAEGRGLKMSAVTAIADGRVFSGRQAHELKLVDEIGTLDAAVREAAKMAKIEGEPRVVYPPKPHAKITDFLMDRGMGEDDEDDFEGESFVGQAANGLADSARRFLGLPGLSSGSAIPAPGIYWLWNGGR